MDGSFLPSVIAFSQPKVKTARGPAAIRTLTERLCTLVDRVQQWQERAAQRHHLRGLDDGALKDIALSRADAEREGGRPFWQR